jgi:hypothetical protein
MCRMPELAASGAVGQAGIGLRQDGVGAARWGRHDLGAAETSPGHFVQLGRPFHVAHHSGSR